MPYTSVVIQQFDIRDPNVQSKIRGWFPDKPYLDHLNKLPEIVQRHSVLSQRSGKVSLIFCDEEIYAVSFSSLGECARGLDRFFKRAKSGAGSSITMEICGEGHAAQSVGIASLLAPIITYILGIQFSGLNVWLKLWIGLGIMVALILYYFRIDLQFRFLKWRFNKKWR